MGCVVWRKQALSDVKTTDLSLTWLRVVLVTLSSLFSVSRGILVSDILTGVTRWTGKGILTLLGPPVTQDLEMFDLASISCLFVRISQEHVVFTCADNCSLRCLKCCVKAHILQASSLCYLQTHKIIIWQSSEYYAQSKLNLPHAKA